MKAWWVRLAQHARPHGPRLLLSLLLTLMGVGLNALTPWSMKLVVDYILAGRPLPDEVAWITLLPGGGAAAALLAWLSVATVLLFLLSSTITASNTYLLQGVGDRMSYALGAELFEHVQRLSLRFHGQARVGDLVRRVTTDSDCVQDLLVGVLLPAVTSVASLAVMFTIMWQLDHTLALVAVLVAIPLGILMRLTGPKMTQRTYEQETVEGQQIALAEQTLCSLPMIQAFSGEEREEGRFRRLSGSAIRAHLHALSSELQFTVGVEAAIALGTAVIMGIGAVQVLQGSLSVGDLLVVLTYLAFLYSPLETIAYFTSRLSVAGAGARRVFEILDTELEVRDAPGATPLPKRAPEKGRQVRLERVTFGYETGRPVLQDVSLEAYPGEVVALVGPTGAGKSTLASLLVRFFDPWKGRITFDGQDLRDIPLSNLRANVAMVLQESLLLPLTVADNIAYGRPGASRGDVVAAAVAAQADAFIRRLPQGYDTVLAERGQTLSGGEKQRLSIARALLMDAPLLILDEPTSSLDMETEEVLLQALERLVRGRTAVIIAHRLSTIQRADRIVVLDGGRVVENGTHDELIRRRGLYPILHGMQFGTAAKVPSEIRGEEAPDAIYIADGPGTT